MVQGDDQHTTLVLSAAGGGKGSAGAGKSRAAGGGQPKQPKPAKPEGAPAAVGRGRSARPRIGVISDTHGYLDPAVVKLFGGVTHIIHAGDVGDAAILATLEAIAPVTAVSGNVESDDLAHSCRRVLHHHAKYRIGKRNRRRKSDRTDDGQRVRPVVQVDLRADQRHASQGTCVGIVDEHRRGGRTDQARVRHEKSNIAAETGSSVRRIELRIPVSADVAGLSPGPEYEARQ